MKFTAAVVLAAAAGVSAGFNSTGNVTYTTEVVDVYTTYCPLATEVTHNGKTYTVTEATTLTITDCPCTVTKPVIPTSAVVCHTCNGAAPSGPAASGPAASGPAPSAPAAPGVSSAPAPGAPAPGYTNSTVPVVPTNGAAPSVPGAAAPTGTGSVPGEKPSSVPTNGAGKAAALSGAGLAGLVGVAAFFL